MQQNGNNRGRPYDQNRDTLHTAAPSGSKAGSTPPPVGTDNGYGFNGEPLSRPPSRSASGTVRRSRADNSIEFPVQPRQQAPSGGSRRSTAQLRVSSGGASRPAQQRPAGTQQNRNGRTRRPASAQQRSAGSAQRTKAQQQRYQNQRLRPTQKRNPAQRERSKKRRLTRAAVRRRRIIRRLTAFALLLCVIAAGVYLTVTMLFRINSIQVQTADGTQVQEAAGYTSDQILQTLGLHLEENIFSFDPAAKEAVLERQFPLLESIRVERDYPNTVVVKVTEAVPTYAMQTKSGWLTISDTFKILACDAAQPTGLCMLYGGEVESEIPGEQLQFTAQTDADSASAAAGSASAAESASDQTDEKMTVLTTLQEKLDEYGLLADVNRIEFADTEEVAFLYQNRVSVLLGTLNDLDYKLDRARYVLNNEDGKGCAPTDTGRLDFSHISASSTRKIYFAQGEPTLPSGYVAQPVVEQPADSTGQDAAADSTAQDGTTDDVAVDELPLTDPARMTATDEEDPM